MSRVKRIEIPVEQTLITIVVRRNIDDGNAELFFFNGLTGRDRRLMCYAHVDQHSEVSLDYFYEKTTDANRHDPDVAALINEWNAQPPLSPFEVRTHWEPFGVIVK